MSMARTNGRPLENKTAIVTGGASGIGAAICLEFAAQGAQIAIADINDRQAEDVAQSIQIQGGQAIFQKVDVCDHKAVTETVATIMERLGTIDILVNCAGFNSFSAPTDVTAEQWAKLLAINLDGPWNFCRAVMPELMKKRSGKIINIGSAAGVLGIPKAIPYSVAKHGVVGLTRALAVDLGPYNINVNCICPATVQTPLAEATLNPVFFAEMGVGAQIELSSS